MRVLLSLFRHMLQWDRPSQIALVLAIVLLMIALVIYANVPDLRTSALVAIIGLTLTIQAVVMWGNRTLVTAYTRAQRLFLAGELAEAGQLLEQEIATIQANNQPVKVDLLVLLGNIHRAQGKIEISEATLREAHQRAPRYHFALYGLGRTLLVKGDFIEAARLIEQALAAGAPDAVNHDLAIARFCQADMRGAQEALERVMPTDDPARKLMAAYITQDAIVPEPEMLLFWNGEYERFAATPYGAFLREFLDAAQTL
jgi:tetratricopeptide (TPR) repeat protein